WAGSLGGTVKNLVLPSVVVREPRVFHGTPEWLAVRDTMVTASDVAAIMGRNPYKSREDVLVDKLTARRSVMTDAMKGGLKWEPAILQAFEALTGWETVRSQELLFSARLEGLGATCDGFCQETKTRVGLVEVKNMSRGLLDQDPPEYYRIQVLTQLYVTGLETGHLCARFGKNGCRIWDIEPNKKFELALEEAVVRFMADLKENAL
ncbi:MAG TPA: YqaJ viral recombinase family protein, partial [Candidatus Paceibacterota bacterium]